MNSGYFRLADRLAAVQNLSMKISPPVVIFMFFIGLASTAAAQYTPTISGINAWWWLGSGITYDGSGCTTNPPGACYYSQAPLTANPNGAPGTPVWSVQTVPGGGSISLDCYTCTSVVATATGPSNGCTYDVTVTVSYGSYTSAPLHILINQPTTTTLVGGYPTHSTFGLAGYDSIFEWALTDSCGYQDSGMDGNESYGSFQDEYYFTYGLANNWDWSYLRPNGTYLTSYIWGDEVAADCGGCIPTTTGPQTPLGSTFVEDDSPWTLRAFTQTIGGGVLIHSDDQQWGTDHGAHQ